MAAVPHSQFGDICNAICRQVGLATMTDEAKFNAKSGLQRTHLQIIMYVDDADAKLALRLSELFTTRRFVTNTADGVKEVDINAMADLEGVKYHSFRCNTAGNQKRLNFIPYDVYRELNPNLQDLEEGAPRSWTYFDQPEENARSQSTRQVVLYPVPDGVYELEYSAKVNHTALTNYSDKVLWPPQFEHVLINFGRAMIEEKMGTGNYMEYAQAALDNVRQWATAPADNVKKVNMGGVKIGGAETNWNYGNIGFEWGGY